MLHLAPGTSLPESAVCLSGGSKLFSRRLCVFSCQCPVLLQFGLSKLLLHPLQQLRMQQHIQGSHGQSFCCPQGEELSFVITLINVKNSVSDRHTNKHIIGTGKTNCKMKCKLCTLCLCVWVHVSQRGFHTSNSSVFLCVGQSISTNVKVWMNARNYKRHIAKVCGTCTWQRREVWGGIPNLVNDPSVLYLKYLIPYSDSLTKFKSRNN